MKEKLYFYYTNDLHSQFNNWPFVARYLKDVKNTHEKNNESSWIFDIGDHLDRMHIIGEAFLGEANVEMMNQLHYDVVTIGNNEGITLSHKELFHLYDQADFQVVCSNLTSQTKYQPSWLNTVVPLWSDSGIPITVLGVTAPFNDYYNLLDWHVDPVFAAIEEALRRIQNRKQIIILLSHVGLETDRVIAKRFPELDVIIGGHTHHLLYEGEIVAETLLTAAGKGCDYVGNIEITWCHKTEAISHKAANITKVTGDKRDLLTEKLIFDYNTKANKILAETITTIDDSLSVDWFQETRVMKDLTKTLMEWTKSDGAFLNAGLLLKGFAPGNITRKDIHESCPHPINPCVISLRGFEILRIIQKAAMKETENFPFVGFGFRGEIIGKMTYAGLSFPKKRVNGEEIKTEEVWIQGEMLEENKIYKIATADMFTFGNLFPEIVQAQDISLFLPEYLRDLLAHSLRENHSNLPRQ